MKSVLIVLAQALGTFAIIGTGLSILPNEEWYVRVFDFPRLQLFFLALLCLVLYLCLKMWKRKRDMLLLVGLVASLVYQAINIYPYTLLSDYEVKEAAPDGTEADELSVLVSNVYMDNNEYEQLINLITEKTPDIVLTLETDKKWEEAIQPATDAYTHRVEIPLDNTYGMHLYSKLPLRQQKVRYLLDDDIPSIKTFVQLRNGTWVELHAVHPKPPVPTEDANSRKRDAEIVMVAKDIEDSKHPVVVAGDFNDVAWSRTTSLFQEVSKLLDPRIGRGFFNTFHANYRTLRWPLDHVFHSNHFKLVRIERLRHIGSDHFPIYIKLSFDPKNTVDQEEPEADEETHEEAEKTVKEGKQEAQED